MKTVQLTTEGIKKHLDSTSPEQAIAEYIWNGLDAKATSINVSFSCNDAGGIEEISISDNGLGISHEEIEKKFGVFLDSEKIKLRQNTKRISSETHGKDGIGRLTFFLFSQNATWKTTYEQGGEKYFYTIKIIESDLIRYPFSAPQKTSKNTATGTKVTFQNIRTKNIDLNSKTFFDYINSEFCWKLALQDNLNISINEKKIDFTNNIADLVEYCPLTPNKPIATIKLIRWKNKLHREYSRYYFLDSIGNERYTDFTSLNKKGDNFFHSVYVKSSFFDNFSTIDSPTNQTDLDFGGNTKKNEWFKTIINSIDHLLREVRKDFLKKSKDDLIDRFQEKGVLPNYNSKNIWEITRHNQLTETVGELYNIQPSLFTGGSIEQKKIFIRLIDQLLDSDEADSLYQIISQVLDLELEEKNELLGVLKSSKLRSVIKTVKLIQDRYRALEQIKRLNWDENLRAKEVPHIQTFMESHFWIIGEEFSMVVSAEKDFEQALRELYIKINQSLTDNSHISHQDKNKEMDIMLIRQDKFHNRIHNIVLELKHPNKKLGKKFFNQIETYFEVISSEPRFNASNMEWSYYLIGNEFDSTGFIENQIENAKPHGEPSLVYKVRNHKIYVKRWSELITDVELRHQFLNDRLEIQRDRLATEENLAKTADDVIKRAKELSCSIHI